MDIEKLFHDWRNSVKDAAKAKADVVYLTEFRKSKKAILMQEAATNGYKTGQEREAYAYSHQEYLDLLLGLKAATEKHEELRNRMVIAQERIGIYRTHEANKRKEFNNYGN